MFDTNVIATAFRSRQGAGNALLRLVAIGHIVPLATTALFLEYEDVLKRPEQREVTGLTHDDVDAVLAALASATEPVTVHISWRPQLLDPGDELVFEAAVTGRADALATYNIRHFEVAARRFGLPVLRPARCLRR